MALIIAPPGSGKSTWLSKNTGWVEGDDMYPTKFLGRERTSTDLQLLEKLNNQLKEKGHQVITGDWWTLEGVDAVVLPPVQLLRDRLSKEERPGHDPDKADSLLRSFVEMRKDPQNDLGLEVRHIPIFETIEEAVAFVEEENF